MYDNLCESQAWDSNYSKHSVFLHLDLYDVRGVDIPNMVTALLGHKCPTYLLFKPFVCKGQSGKKVLKGRASTLNEHYVGFSAI